MRYIFVLGRHTALSLAEIKAVLPENGAVGGLAGRFLVVTTTTPLSPQFLSRLGGTDRIVEVLADQDHEFTAEEVVRALPRQYGGQASFTEKKLTLGISGLSPQAAKSLGSAFKKLLRQQNKSVRFIIPNGTAPLLNAAQVFFNSLLTSQNVELLFAQIGGRLYAGKTIQIQDIQAYERRDTARPARDAKVGMLPPKLAQIMLNVAVGPATGLTIYDPFCGTGVVLQEGWLMGHTMLGSDSNPKMVAASQQNLNYLAGHFPTLRLAPLAHGKPRLFQHDVQQPFLEDFRHTIDAIVTEPYLGRPFSAALSPTQVEQAQKELKQLYRAFFTNALLILKPGGRILFLLPVIRQAGGPVRRSLGVGGWAFFEEAFLDEVAQLGYGRKQLVPRGRGDAVYARPDAVVGRELTLWEKL